MRILLNSDVLFRRNPLGKALPESHQRLAIASRDQGHVLVIPLTTQLELERQQIRAREDDIKRLESAYKVMDQHGVSFERRDPSELIRQADVVALLRGEGATVEVEEPTLVDYQDAHRRACLHESPQPPDTKSDEMRDLVIWSMSLRVAREHGGAMLLSRDLVHTHERGHEEAGSVGLVRIGDIDEALEYLNGETPTGKVVLAVLQAYWPSLLASELPLPDSASLRMIQDAELALQQGRISNVICRLELLSDNGEPLSAQLDYEVLEGVGHLRLYDIVRGEASYPEIRASAPEPNIAFPVAPYDERVNELQRTIGGALEP